MAGFVDGLDYDVFVSYAHIDNERSKWVETFSNELEARLAVELGMRVSLWRDNRKLDGLDQFDGVIETALRRSALFIAIVSPSYVNSKYCLKEVRCFLDAGGGTGSGEKSRLARVRKMQLNGLSEPSELAASETLGFPFFDEKDPTTEFEAAGPTQSNFQTAIRRLAGACAVVLRRMRDAAKQPTAERTIFLAETTTKLVAARAMVKAELEALGHRVVPTTRLIADSTLDESALRKALSEASYAVHLFGEAYGVVPEGSDISLPHAQYEAAATAGLPQIVWIKPDDTPVPKQQLFMETLQGEATSPGRRVDLCKMSLADFDDALRDVLVAPAPAPPVPAVAATGSSVYLVAPEEDLSSEDLRALRRSLLNSGFPVDLPVFQAPPGELRSIEEQRILANDATIIYYANAPDAWVDQKRKFVINSLGRTERKARYCRAVYVARPRTTLKAASYGDFLGSSIPEAVGVNPLLVVGDFEAFSPEKIQLLLDNLTRLRDSVPPVSSVRAHAPSSTRTPERQSA